MCIRDRPRGGQTVLESAHDRFSRNYKHIIPHFSLSSFKENYNRDKGITNIRLNQDFQAVLIDFEDILNGD